MLLRALSLFLLAVLNSQAFGQGSTVCLRLDPRSSSLTFDAAVGPVPIVGKFLSYKSGWAADLRNPERSSVWFQTIPTEFRLSSTDQMNVFVDTLLRSIPPTPVTFRSTSIRRIAGHRYSVEGNVIRGGRTNQVRFPVDMTFLTQEGGQIRADLKGSAADLIPGTVTQGTVTANLRYLRGNPSDCH